MADPINDRLAGRIEQLQIERIVRVEQIAGMLDLLVNSTLDSVLAVAVSRRAQDSKRVSIARKLRALPGAFNAVLDRQFFRLARWSQSEFVNAFARTIPRNWIRAIEPAALLVGEDESTPAPGVSIPGGPEPAVTDRMTDAEWSDWVAANVFPPPAAEVVREIIHRPNAGVDYAERISGLSALVEPERIAQSLVEGVAEGEAIEALSRRILPQVDGNVRASAKRIARTEGLRIANTMQRESYKDLGDLVIGFQILATLDQNTRPEHALRHGTIYYNDGRQPSADTMPLVPDEPNCRCMDVPVMRPPEELADDPALSAVFSNAAGHAIPDPASYSAWWSSVDIGRRKLSVGSGRYNAMSRKLQGVREPEWEDFIEPDGTRLKIGEIRSESDESREDRRQLVFAGIRERAKLLQRIR